MSKAYQDGIADGEAGCLPAKNRRGAYVAGYTIGAQRRDERLMVDHLERRAGEPGRAHAQGDQHERGEA